MSSGPTLVHLTRRFLGSLSPRPLAPDDDRWARARLTPGEVGLWERMPVADRKHAVGVAKEVQRHLGDAATRPVLAAALLHDVGKIDSGLGTLGRVVATLAAAAFGRERAARWRAGRGLRRRVGLYLIHPRLGGDLLALAGAEPLTVDWAREHHRPEDEWSVPPVIGRALRDADDD